MNVKPKILRTIRAPYCDETTLNADLYGARFYDPLLPTWDRIDPMCEKYYHLSPYAYCLDNPVKFLDRDGFDPGDFFYTMDEAAMDFGLTYNDNSIREGREYSSAIIKIKNKKGLHGYTYTLPNIGSDDNVNLIEGVYGYEMVARVHTHGKSRTGIYVKETYDNEFSGLRMRNEEARMLTLKQRKAVTDITDIGNANRDKLNSYVATPNGSLQKYDYKSGKITMISTDMPSDVKDPERLNSISALMENNKLGIDAILKVFRKMLYKDF